MTIKPWILLTATINPPTDADNLAVTSGTMRLKQYCEALEFYLRTFGPGSKDGLGGIVFAENSGADLSKVEAVSRSCAPGFTKFISWTEKYLPPAFDRGYRELRLIKTACAELPDLTRVLAEGAIVWKVTGRYKVLNLRDIMAQRGETRDLYLDLRTWPKPWCEMRVLGFNAKSLAGFIEAGFADLTTGAATEELLFKFLERHFPKTAPSAISICRRFPVEPRVDGIRGGDGANYLSGKNYFKYLLRSAVRKAGRFCNN